MDYEFLTTQDQEALVDDQLRNLEREHFQLSISLPAGIDPDHPASIRLREVESRVVEIKAHKDTPAPVPAKARRARKK